MITGTHINAALFIPMAIGTSTAFPPETPDFVKRERERESLSDAEAEERNWRQGDKETKRTDRGTRGEL